jgi:transcriptional regulator with XRE-family HTH domain
MTDLDKGMLRRQRFKELIEYALVRSGSGGVRASQRYLSQLLGLSPSMIRRYLDGEAEVEEIRYVTIRSLAEVAGIDVGTLSLWLERGREVALEHESRRLGNLKPYTIKDLAERIVELAAFEAEPLPAPGLDLEPLRRRVRALRLEVGPVFDRLCSLAGCIDAVERLYSQQPLVEGDWELLAGLLELDVATLQEECGHSGGDQAALARRDPTALRLA